MRHRLCQLRPLRGWAVALGLYLIALAAVWWALPPHPRFSVDRAELLDVGADGRTIITARHHYRAAGPARPALTSWSGPVEVRDALSGRVLAACLDERTMLHSPWASPDGRRLIHTDDGPDRRMRLLDITSGAALATFPHAARTGWVRFAPDGNTLAYQRPDGAVLNVWDVERRQGWEIPARAGTFAFAPDGRTLAVAPVLPDPARPVVPGPPSGGWGHDLPTGEIELWDLATRERRGRLVGVKGLPVTLGIAPDGSTLAACWSTRPPKKKAAAPGPVAAPPFPAAGGGGRDPDEKERFTTQVWADATGRELAVLPDAFVPTFTPDGRGLMAVVGGHPATELKLWDTRTWEVRAHHRWPGPDTAVQLMDPSGPPLPRRAVVVRDVTTTPPTPVERWLGKRLNWASWTQPSQSATLTVRDVVTGDALATVVCRGWGDACLLPGGQALVVRQEDSQRSMVQVWDVPPRKPVSGLVGAAMGLGLLFGLVGGWRARRRKLIDDPVEAV